MKNNVDPIKFGVAAIFRFLVIGTIFVALPVTITALAAPALVPIVSIITGVSSLAGWGVSLANSVYETNHGFNIPEDCDNYEKEKHSFLYKIEKKLCDKVEDLVGGISYKHRHKKEKRQEKRTYKNAQEGIEHKNVEDSLKHENVERVVANSNNTNKKKIEATDISQEDIVEENLEYEKESKFSEETNKKDTVEVPQESTIEEDSKDEPEREL